MKCPVENVTPHGETTLVKIKIVEEFPEGLYRARHGYYPKYTIDEFTGNLDDVLRDIPWDSDTAPGQGADIPRYQVVEHELPSWMSPRYFIDNQHDLKALWTVVPKETSEAWQKRLMKIYEKGGHYYLYIVMQLICTKKFKSDFRKGLHDHLVEWLDDPNPKYDLPFSARQFQSLDTSYSQRDYNQSWGVIYGRRKSREAEFPLYR
jgi:hypothetical protein